MKRRRNQWPSTPNAERYKLFSEIVFELTNDESWESYRHHSLSSMMKLTELSHRVRGVLAKQVAKASLGPMVEEVNYTLNSDPIVNLILSSGGFDRNDFLLNPNDSSEDILNGVHLLIDLLFQEYSEICQNEIIRICNDRGSKIRLSTCAKLYVSHVYCLGFSRQYIHRTCKRLFYDYTVHRCDSYLLRRFFSEFGVGNRNYKVVVSCSAAMAEFLNSTYRLKRFSELSEFVPEAEIGGHRRFGSGKKKRLVLLEIPAKDQFGAASTANSIVGIAKALVNLHPSSVSPAASDTVFVYSGSLEVGELVSKKNLSDPRKSLRSRLADMEGPQSLASYVFSSENEQDFSRIFNSLSSLTLSVSAENAQSRLLPLWAAFEALLPEPRKDGDATVRITHFVPLVVPAVCLGYIRNSYLECYKNCVEEFGQPFSDLVEGSGTGRSIEEKFATLLISENPVRKPLFKMVSDSPLMLQRIFKLGRMLEEPQKALDYLQQHKKRVEWQIHRIYRERNDIVHTGSHSKVTDALVENAYSYFRSVFLAIESSSKDVNIFEPSRALYLIEKRFLSKLRSMEEILHSRRMERDEKKDMVIQLVFS